MLNETKILNVLHSVRNKEMNNIQVYKLLLTVLAALLFGTSNVYAQAGVIGEARTLDTHHSFELAKFRVLVSKEDLEQGRVILDCKEIGCTTMEGLYDPDTIVYLPNGEEGVTPDLLNYSGRRADISIRKSDQHVRRIRLYK